MPIARLSITAGPGSPRSALRWLCAVAAVALLSGCATFGRRAATPCTPGTAPRVGIPGTQCSVQDFRFNGATRQPAPSVSFPQATNVRVVVTDANPFLYVYQVESRGQPVTEASIGDFFKLAFNITLAKGAGGGSAGSQGDVVGRPTVMPESGHGEGEDNICQVAAREAAFVTRVVAAQAEHVRIGDEFTRVEELAATANVRMKARADVYLNPELLADTVQKAALGAVAVHDTFATTIGGIRDDLGFAIPRWTATVAALNQEAPMLDTACPEVQLAVGDAAELVGDTAAYRANLQSVRTRMAETAAERDRLHAVARDPGRFYYASVLERFDRPTDVLLIVRRKTLAPKDTFHHVATQRINVGGRARFSMSAGLGWTSMGTTTYGLTTRFVTPHPGATDTVNAVVVARENSDQHIFPMLTFNTRLTPSDLPATGHLVLGVGLARAGGQALPGYLLGLGVDTFGQRLLVTGGVFFGEEHRLGAGLRVGDRVPGGLNPIPMEKRMVGKLGIGLTYRMF